METAIQRDLRRVKQNDRTLRILDFGHRFAEEEDLLTADQVAQFEDDIANNTHLQRLDFDVERYFSTPCRHSLGEVLIKGVQRNSSIKGLRLEGCDFDFSEVAGKTGVEILEVFRKKGNLAWLCLHRCVGLRNCDFLASAIRDCKNLNLVIITQSLLTHEHLTKLVGAFRALHQLKVLDLDFNNIGREGCELLATLLQNPRCSLVTLFLSGNNIDDGGMAVLSSALAKNKTLKQLNLDQNDEISDVGWGTLYRVLCDTSSITATYLSNHTLKKLGDISPWAVMRGSLHSILAMNEASIDIKEAAVKKILICHSHFDMEPFLQWDLKLLPYVVRWYDMAKLVLRGAPNIEVRKLDSIYQFTRSMPMKFLQRPPPRAPMSSLGLSIVVAILSVAVYLAREVLKARLGLFLS